MQNTKKIIEELIKAEYEAYGFDGKADVRVSESGEITIHLNHETPYMGDKFFEFLRTLQDKLSNDYKKKSGSYYYSFYIMQYVKK